MRKQCLIECLLQKCFEWLTPTKTKQKDNEIIIRRTFLWIFTLEKIIINLDNDDLSTITTKSYSFISYYLILNGESIKLPKKAWKRLTELFKANNLIEAPLLCSSYTTVPEYVIQLGRSLAYLVDNNEWEYKYVSYNIANLRKNKKYLLVNTAPLLMTDDSILDSYIKLLKDRECTRDPYILSPQPVLNPSLWERIMKYIVTLLNRFSNKEKMEWRLQYLLLGKDYCFAELNEAKIDNIVYYDYKVNGGVLIFGTGGTHFCYPKQKSETCIGIKEYFISRGAPLEINGESFTTRMTFNPLTWIKRYRQTITLGGYGVYYTRRIKKMIKTSFIPYFDLYFIVPKRWRLMGRKLEVFGSQNITTAFPFKNKDYKRIVTTIYEKNPSLAKSHGKAYRSFTWNPFLRKPYVIIDGGRLMHGHPKRKDKLAIEGIHVRDVKRYGWFYHFFRDVVIDVEPTNIRYDECAKYDLQIGPFIKGSKIDPDDEWLEKTWTPIFVTHMWVCSSKRLVSDVRLLKGKEASERSWYEGSIQQKKDLEEKMAVMAAYANKPSLISFITKLRIATGCDPLREYEIEIPFEIENEEVEETLTRVEDDLDLRAENISKPWYKSINWTNIWGYIVSIVKNQIFITVAICAAVVYGAYIGLTVLEFSHLRNTSTNKHELVESRSVKKTPAQKSTKTTPEPDNTDKVERPRAESFDSAEEYFTEHTSDIASSYGDAHYDGFFYAGEKKFPISIYYFLTSDMSVISCTYTNVNYKTETNMDVTFTGSEMILRGLDGKNEFVMHFSPTSNGNWEGWAQSGKQRLRATLRPRR